jgi:enoyl-CoA hydratase
VVAVSDGVARVTLNRPEARNALTAELWSDLAETVEGLEHDAEVGAIVLTGSDPAFCAGFDLRRLSQESRELRQLRQREAPRFLGMLPPHDTPVVAAVNGPAVTGGLELALACDVLVASDRARFADTHARVGVMPGGGLTIRLPALVGPSRALRMSLTGDFIDAATALGWGLVSEVVPHDRLLEAATAVAGSMATVPRANLVEIRRMYAEVATLVGEAAWRRENELSREWMRQRFDQERLAAERQGIIERGRRQA